MRRSPSLTSIKISPRNSKLEFQGPEWLRWSELFLRGIVLLACIAALVIPIVISVTIKHQLTVSYAAAIYGLCLNGFEIISVTLRPRSHYASSHSCCVGMLDFLAIPLFAFGAIGAALDGNNYSSGKPPTNTGGPFHWPEAWLLTGLGISHLVLFFIDCVNARPCCSPKKRVSVSDDTGDLTRMRRMRESEADTDGSRPDEAW